MPDKIGEGIPILSMGLKRFVERMVKDDDFFSLALENPVAAMKEMGVNLDASKMEPESIAAFLGALSNVRDSLKNKNIKDFTFEKIFGQPATVTGVLIGETDQGICREFIRSAYIKRLVIINRTKVFPLDRQIPSLIYRTAYVDVAGPTTIPNATVAINARVSASQQTEVGYNKSWEGKDAARTRGTHRVANVNFGNFRLQDLLVGPLISPEDLNGLAVQINASVSAREAAAKKTKARK
jgi:hypothetical protein